MPRTFTLVRALKTDGCATRTGKTISLQTKPILAADELFTNLCRRKETTGNCTLWLTLKDSDNKTFDYKCVETGNARSCTKILKKDRMQEKTGCAEPGKRMKNNEQIYKPMNRKNTYKYYSVDVFDNSNFFDKSHLLLSGRQNARTPEKAAKSMCTEMCLSRNVDVCEFNIIVKLGDNTYKYKGVKTATTDPKITKITTKKTDNKADKKPTKKTDKKPTKKTDKKPNPVDQIEATHETEDIIQDRIQQLVTDLNTLQMLLKTVG